jgi:hypothetical protein
MKPGKINPETIVNRAIDLPFTRLDEEMLAIDEKAGYFYSLNESAARVWELIKNPIPVSVICVRLCEEYAVDEKTCRGDLLQLLQSLKDAGLLEVKDGLHDQSTE